MRASTSQSLEVSDRREGFEMNSVKNFFLRRRFRGGGFGFCVEESSRGSEVVSLGKEWSSSSSSSSSKSSSSSSSWWSCEFWRL